MNTRDNFDFVIVAFGLSWYAGLILVLIAFANGVK